MACRFHLGQSWWRKIQINEVNETSTELLSVCPNDVGYLFTDYILKNYIVDECLFSPELWAEKPSMNPRTSNASESFHRTYNARFHHPHPHIYLVLKVLMEFQLEIETKIKSITLFNDEKILNAKEKERMEFTMNAYNKYKSYKIDIIQFLSEVGPRYQGKQL
ncbi:Hypothetical protein CINCED_3A006660 [Cinara cedri]|uniref:Uncharacterized protein n=1 Tax=Cinara cedri TaxID=506608 RepID=A0A5E4NFX4_9HEMI|nr:Hypothetical protein CINCED_3A006660 [Cinara cedri]